MDDIAVIWHWGEFAIRWLHVITGIAWIGSSFYFIALDLGLRKAPGMPEAAHGEEWQVHGGGFYHIQPPVRLEQTPLAATTHRQKRARTRPTRIEQAAGFTLDQAGVSGWFHRNMQSAPQRGGRAENRARDVHPHRGRDGRQRSALRLPAD